MDNSNECINVNIWGEMSENIIKEGDMIIINGARVTNFGGKSLNVSSEHAQIFINPGEDIINGKVLAELATSTKGNEMQLVLNNNQSTP